MSIIPVFSPYLSASLSFVDSDEASLGSTASPSISGLSFGADVAGRVLFLVVSLRAGAGSRVIQSATIGGTSATIRQQVNNNFSTTAIISAAGVSGTSGTVVINMNGVATSYDILFSIYSANSLVSAVPTDTASSIDEGVSATLNVDVSAGGFVLAVSSCTNTEGENPGFNAGVTENAQALGLGAHGTSSVLSRGELNRSIGFTLSGLGVTEELEVCAAASFR